MSVFKGAMRVIGIKAPTKTCAGTFAIAHTIIDIKHNLSIYSSGRLQNFMS